MEEYPEEISNNTIGRLIFCTQFFSMHGSYYGLKIHSSYIFA